MNVVHCTCLSSALQIVVALAYWAPGVRSGEILTRESCFTRTPGIAAIGHSDLKKLNLEKSYNVLDTALPRKMVSGNGKLLRVREGKPAAAEQPLSGETANRKDILRVLEHIIPAEFGMGKCKSGSPCDAGWKDVNKRQRNIVYMSSLVDLDTFRQRVYIDGGSRGFDSSIGSWFQTVYPQSNKFDAIFAFDIGPRFSQSYVDKENVTFIPCALSTKDETLEVFGNSMNTIHKSAWVAKSQKSDRLAHAVDFSNWLHATVSPEDFVVLKLDIEGAEHEVLEHLMATKAIYFIDELFVE